MMSERYLRATTGQLSRELAPLQQRALQQLSERVASIPAPRRRSMHTLFAHAEVQILHARGIGAEVALGSWLKACTTTPLPEWLSQVPVTRGTGTAPDGNVAHGADHQWRVLAVLLL